MSISIRSHPTERVREVFALAHDLADRRGDAALAPAHLALGLLQEGENIPVYILRARGVPLDVLAREFETELPASGTPREPARTWQWAFDDEPFVEQATREARELDTVYYGCEHLFLALLRDPAGAPARVLARHRVGLEDVCAEVLRIRRQ